MVNVKGVFMLIEKDMNIVYKRGNRSFLIRSLQLKLTYKWMLIRYRLIINDLKHKEWISKTLESF